jgi:hypothetical protein
MFNQDYFNRFKEVTPHALRKPKFFALLRVLALSFGSIQNELNQLRAEMQYRFSFTGETYSIEALLNNEFDPVQRRIRVRSLPFRQPMVFLRQIQQQVLVFLRTNIEAPEHYLVSNFTFNNWQPQEFEFEVVVPSGVIYNTPVLRELVDRYRFAGKRYRIVNVQTAIPELPSELAPDIQVP